MKKWSVNDGILFECLKNVGFENIEPDDVDLVNENDAYTHYNYKIDETHIWSITRHSPIKEGAYNRYWVHCELWENDTIIDVHDFHYFYDEKTSAYGLCEPELPKGRIR